MEPTTRPTGFRGWFSDLLCRFTGTYPGDFAGMPAMEYTPVPDGRPDPGEVVWTWVPFEEDHRQGKDRPVLLIGRDGRWLLGLMLSTRQRPAQDQSRYRHRPRWIDIGTGPWDRQRRPSQVRVDRVIRVNPGRVRREGATLDAARFGQVASAVARRR